MSAALDTAPKFYASHLESPRRLDRLLDAIAGEPRSDLVSWMMEAETYTFAQFDRRSRLTAEEAAQADDARDWTDPRNGQRITILFRSGRVLHARCSTDSGEACWTVTVYPDWTAYAADAGNRDETTPPLAPQTWAQRNRIDTTWLNADARAEEAKGTEYEGMI